MKKLTDARAPHVATGRMVAKQGHDVARALYAAFEQFNGEHFGRKLGAPLVLVTQAASARTLGDYCEKDLHGLESRIRIAPRAVQRGLAFALDVLLHEMVHAWAFEVSGDTENGYRGHGPKFAGKCNEIGAALGLPEVGVKGRDGKPDCAHWPMCVRPARYYGEAYAPPKRRERSRDEDDRQENEGESSDEVLDGLRKVLTGLSEEQLQELGAEVVRELKRRKR